MNPRRLTPDFWLVAMEETANWEKHITEQAGRIFAVYLFDRRRRVHCCELTPSYELHWLYDTFVSPNLSDRESEKLDEEIMLGCAETPPVSYFHCHEIDRILRLPGRAFHIGRDQKTWHLLLRDWNDSEKAHGEMTEALREHYQCNWMLPGRQAPWLPEGERTMRLHWLRFVNIAKYVDTRIDFEERQLMALLGTNGIGKSHLMAAPALLLWGKIPKGKKILNFAEAVRWGANEGMIEGELTHMGQRWYAYRRLRISESGKTRSPEAALYRIVDGMRESRPFAGPAVSDFNEKIETIFGTLEVFLACVVSAQKAAGDLLEVDRDKRYEIFSQMIGAQRLLEVGELAKEARKAVAGQLKISQAQRQRLAEMAENPAQMALLLAAAREQIQNLGEAINRLTAEHTTASQDVSRLEEAQRERQESLDQLEQLEKDLAELLDQRQNLAGDLLEAETLVNSRERLQVNLAEHRENEQILTAMRKTAEEANRLEAEYARLLSEILSAAQQIQDDERQLEADSRRQQELRRRNEELRQIYQDYTALGPKEYARASRQQILQNSITETNERLKEATEQVQLLQEVPQPAGICRQCKLTALAVAASEKIPELEQALDRYRRELQLVSTPIIVPAYNGAEHNRVNDELVRLGDLDKRQLAITNKKRELRELSYQREDAHGALGKLAFDPLKLNELEGRIKQDSSVAADLIKAETVLGSLPRLHQLARELDEKNQALDQQLAEVRRRASTPDQAQALAQAQADHISKSNALNETRSSLESQLREEGQLISRQRQAVQLQEKLAELDLGITRLEAKDARLAQLQLVFSKRGVLPLLIDQARPEIEDNADKILSRVWPELGRIGVKTDDKGSEVLDIVVRNGRDEHLVDLYSAGEQQILRIVLRLAIGRYRAKHSGQRYDLIGFDETFDALAPENASKVLRLLMEMLDLVSQVLVISHTEDTVLDIPERLVLEQSSAGVRAEWRN